MRSQGSIFVLVALLLAFIVMDIPTTANAVEGTIQLLDVNLNALTPAGNFGDPSALSVSLGADFRFPPGDANGTTCDLINFPNGPCVSIKNGSTLKYTGGSGGQALGTLTFSPLVVQNISTFPVVVVIKYGHTNTAVNIGTSTLCAGMSLSGYFDDVTGGAVDTNDFTDIQMTVTWLGCNQPSCNVPFQIGSQNLAPCPNSVLVSKSPALLQASAQTNLTYGPASPPQVVNIIPSACPSNSSGCTAAARIDKIYRTRLGVGDSSQQIGSDVAFTDLCGDPDAALKPKKGQSPVCTGQDPKAPTYNAALLPEQIDWVIPGNTITATKNGSISSTIFDNLAVKCTDIIYTPGVEPVLSVLDSSGQIAASSPLGSVSFKTGECDMKHDETPLLSTPLLSAITCNTTFLVLSGHLENSATPGTVPIPFGPIAAPVRVNCPNPK